jgi:hypothetical protein
VLGPEYPRVHALHFSHSTSVIEGVKKTRNGKRRAAEIVIGNGHDLEPAECSALRLVEIC